MEGGKEGEIQQKEIQALNENYHLLLSLTGNAEKKDEIKGSYIEKEREKIDFILTVRLVEI